MNLLEDKVALVTGCAVRLGREIALAMAREGCDIVIHYHRSMVEAETLAEEIHDMGRQAWLVCGDFTNPYAPDVVMKTAWEMAGWVDILVNNASVYSQATLADATVEEFDELWHVNALAPVLLTKALARCAAESEILPDDYCGRIVNILDRCVAKAAPATLPYWITKKALEAFTKGAALEMAPRITVNAVAPGPVLAPEGMSEPAGPMPLAVRCIPSDIAQAVIYLARAATITGQILYVDSGQHLL
ncbi:MAG: SDR family NAD(P)-dependent oxidoreductase [Kiritimatiellia bacterium]|jgi:pteridine reductase